MKRLRLILFIAISLCMSCQPNDTTDTPSPSSSDLTILLPSITRLSLGSWNGSKHPLVWGQDDKVSANGVVSEAIEILSNQKATFTFSSKLDYPCSVLYPHNITSENGKALFNYPAEQYHNETEFDITEIPMCGYAKEERGSIQLNTLIGLLRLQMTAKVEGIKLSTIRLTTASNKQRVAGEFSINAAEAKIVPTSNSTTSITYHLPEDFTLSTSETNTFTIVVPSTTLGDCDIVFTTNIGATMKMKWRAGTIAPNSIHEQQPITFEQNSSGTLQPLTVEEDSFRHRFDTIKGHVHDTDGNPIAGVAVSDGFSVTQTNEQGFYQFNITQDAWYIYISIPSEYKIPTNKYGLPCFFMEYPGFSNVFNFTLERLPGGKEDEFMLFGLADPQVSRMTHIERFSAQVAPEIKNYISTLGKPCYGITLGDVISMGSTDLTNTILPAMRDAMHAEKLGMPIFQVMGNHDNCYMTAKHPVYGKNIRDINLNIQRMFETTFGPINYSFNRGDAHIVGMRNIQWKSGDDCSTDNTRTAFTEEQYEWLKQDLAVVPKDKVVVLCVHIPLYNNGSIGDGSYRQEVLSLLDEFAEAHVLSGHLHYMRNYDHSLVSSSTHKRLYEHAQAAVNGASWTSNINGDGVPNGYGVYHFKGNTIKDWYYKGYADGMSSRDYQIRLYRGNTITGAAINDANGNGTKGYYQFGYGDDILLANVFNSDTAWDVEVYEDGVYSGKMTSLSKYHFSVPFDSLIGSFTYDDPKRPAVGVECGQEFWAIGVLCGHLGMNNGGLYYKHCYQLWKYRLKNKNAKRIEVRATDRKGNVYKCTKITDGTDMTYALYNP